MDVNVPAGWSVISQSEYSFAATHSKHSLELDISPVYKASRTAKNKQTEPQSYRVNLDPDWFSEELLGNVSRSATVQTKAEAIERAVEFMREHAVKQAPDTVTTQTDTGTVTRNNRTGPVSTGAETLDEMLNGGLPPNRSILLTGTPGTGKSTLAMQFLQAGLDEDERCLYISTEQTREEIRDAFSTFNFDLSHDKLGISTIHALMSDSGDGGLTIGALDDTEETDSESSFTRKGVIEFLRRGRSADRVVLDSVSGLRPMTDTDGEFRRALLDIIRLFNDEFDATALLTAEHFGSIANTAGSETVEMKDAVQYTVHGVIRAWRQQVSGELRRFIDVRKMRGVDHDSRPFEMDFDEDGINVIPRRRPQTGWSLDTQTISSGIDELDERLGGGFERGGGVLLQYDEQADIDPLLMAIGSEALDQMLSVVFVPGVDTDPERLGGLLNEMGAEMEQMLAHDQLFVIDVYGGWIDSIDSENVFHVNEEAATIRSAFEQIEQRARGQGTAYIVDVPAVIHSIGPKEARKLRNWQEAHVIDPKDVLFDVSNPDLIASEVESFFANSARQILKTWVSENGLQYLKVRKGTTAKVGSVGLVEFIEEKPYIELR